MFRFMQRLMVVAALTTGVFGFDAQAEDTPAPDFSLKDLRNKQVSLSDYKGKVVLINFWATWCGPCISEMKKLEKIYKDNHEKGLEILAVSIDDARDKSKMRKEARKSKFSFKVLHDINSEVKSIYVPSSQIPYNVLVDRKGNIVWTKDGYSPGDEEKIEAKILEYLEKDKPIEQETK